MVLCRFLPAAALLVQTSLASRLSSRLSDWNAGADGPNTLSKLTANPDVEMQELAPANQDVEMQELAPITVCGDEELWIKMTANPDVRSIREIPWAEILRSIDNVLRDQHLLISNLESNIVSLTNSIQAKEATHDAQDLNADQIRQIVAACVSATGSFGSPDNAKATKCGKPRFRPRMPPDAARVAEVTLQSLAQQIFGSGQLRSNKPLFTHVCHQFLGFAPNEEDEFGNYCGQVCAGLADVTQFFSDKYSVALGSTSTLKAQLRKNMMEHSKVAVQHGKCKQSRVAVASFQEKLSTLNNNVQVRFTAVTKAERELEDAQWALSNLQEMFQSQAQQTSDAVHTLQGESGEVAAAKEALDVVQKHEAQFTEQFGVAISVVEHMREELSNIQQADEATLDIKRLLSMTMFKMGLFVDVAVREPVRKLGLAEETDVWNFFLKDIRILKAADDFHHELNDFHSYCRGPAFKIFKDVNIMKYVDLTPLCELREESVIAADIDRAGQQRVQFVTEDIQKIQSWLDPLKGTGMSAQAQQVKVDQGEPEGLRQVMGVFGRTDFYMSYLKKWKFPSHFHDLLKKLKKKAASLDAELAQAEAAMETLANGLSIVHGRQQEAWDALQRAQAAEGIAESNVVATKNALALLREQAVSSKQQFEDLQRVFQDAKRLYLSAKKTLVEEHSVGLHGVADGANTNIA